MKLYEINHAIRVLLDSEDGEIDADSLADLELAFESKIEAILQFRQELESDANAIKAERDRLKAKEDALKKRSEWLKSYVLTSMRGLGIGKVSTPTFTATVANSPMSVVIEDGAEIVEDYAVWSEPTWNKKKLLDDFKAGATLPEGVTIVQNQHLRIS